MESQPQNPEFRIYHENFHSCVFLSFGQGVNLITDGKLLDVPSNILSSIRIVTSIISPSSFCE